MNTEFETTKQDIRTSLAFRDGFLCAVAERRNPDRSHPTTLKLWYLIRSQNKPRWRRCCDAR
jgi:hypothetical protein